MLDRANACLLVVTLVMGGLLGFSSTTAPIPIIDVVRAKEETPLLIAAIERSEALLAGTVTVRIARTDDPASIHTLAIPLRDHPDWLFFDAETHEFRFDAGRVQAFFGEQFTATVVNDARALTLLSVGRSNFDGSAPGRAANVRRALATYLHGIVVPVGETFSFDAAIADSSGWYDSYVIMNGKDLVLEKGGGICQAATTMYRAALLAGLPVIERANHSLYVTYYKDYGVGIDATFYPDKQNLTFANDTPGDILILARSEGDEAVIELYGIDDGRSVALEGPYFAQTAPDDLLVKDRPMQRNEIAWKYAVTDASGIVREDLIVSRYLAIPRKLHEEYVTLPGITALLKQEQSADLLAMDR